MSSARRQGARKNERGKHHLDAIQQERESFLKQLPPSWGKDLGFRARTAPISKWTVLELDCWADPRKTQEWALEMIATIGMQRFQREFLRNWALSTQSPFFPEYLTRGGDETYAYPITQLGSGPLFMGLDFGYRRPALVAAQTDARRMRLFLIREWMPQNISAEAFLQVCEWLMGEFDEKDLLVEAQKHALDLKRDADKGDGPPVPWFKRPGQVMRYTGPEAYRISQEVASEAQERRVLDIWAANGFPLNVFSLPPKAGELVIRHTMRPVPPNCLPWLVVDPFCKILRQGFGGGYTFKRPTKLNPQPDEPAKDGYYEHLQDGLRYMAAQVIDINAKASDTPFGETNVQQKKKPKLPGTYTRADVKPEEEGGFSCEYDDTRNVRPSVNPRSVYTRGE